MAKEDRQELQEPRGLKVRQPSRGRAAHLVSRGHRGHLAQRAHQDRSVRKVRRVWQATKAPKAPKAHQGQRESLALRALPVLKDPLGYQVQSGQPAKQGYLVLRDQ